MNHDISWNKIKSVLYIDEMFGLVSDDNREFVESFYAGLKGRANQARVVVTVAVDATTANVRSRLSALAQ
jgi:hypothetical protein